MPLPITLDGHVLGVLSFAVVVGPPLRGAPGWSVAVAGTRGSVPADPTGLGELVSSVGRMDVPGRES
jgi:hypothetical protein